MTRFAIAVLLTLGLTGCGSERTQAECAAAFNSVLNDQGVMQNPQLELRYAFDLDERAAVVVKSGVEGVGPPMLITWSGSNVQLNADRRVADLIGGEARPKHVQVFGNRSTLVYSPDQLFTPENARTHMRKMCAMSQQGVKLKTFRVVGRGSVPSA